MSDFSIFLGGENRVVLPFFAYPALVVAPTMALALGVIVPTDRLPSILKQILSIPLLLAVFMIPFGFTNGNRGKLLLFFLSCVYVRVCAEQAPFFLLFI